MENMDASDNSIKTSIFDLNADCLFEISQYLDFKDLTMLYKTHKHFHNSIERCVASKHFTFEILDYERSYFKEMKAISKFLLLFGKRLEGLKIKLPAHYDYHYDGMISLIQINIETLFEICCANGNIKYLSLENFHLSDEFIRDNGIFVKSLRSMVMENKHINSQKKLLLLPLLQNVKILKIHTNYWDNEHITELLYHLRHLETLQLSGFCNRFQVLTTQLSIKRLEIPNCDCDRNLLVKYFPNLEYLEVGDRSKTYSLKPLLYLPKLKHVSLVINEDIGERVLSFMNAIGRRNVLKTLKIRISLMNRSSNKDDLKNKTILFKEIYKMTNLRALTLEVGSACKHHLKEIASSLKQLQRFTLNCIFSGVDYSKMLIPEILKFIVMAEKLEYLSLSLCEVNANTFKFCEELEKIRCNQGSQKILYVSLLVEPKIYRRINEINFQGKYVKSSCHILSSSNCNL